MTYVMSDPHGFYDLFCRLLDKVHFSATDELYIGGDLIDKGPASIRLLRAIYKMPNVFCIMGNHEHKFLQLYQYLSELHPQNTDAVLAGLQSGFEPYDERLTPALLDMLEALPYYIERTDFLCVHAGVSLTETSFIAPLEDTEPEVFIYDRRFKEPNVRHNSRPCVFFGHTPTDTICGQPLILAYPRVKHPQSIADCDKIHLDTGVWRTGVLGCFCVETMTASYVRAD